jgi:hypothetical protein
VTYREQALRYAIAELGVKENPAGSNSGPRVNQYLASAGLGPGYPWCMAFMNWCFRKAGLDIQHPNEASVGFFEAWARENGHLVSAPARGDLICYRFDADNWPDHVGIIERVYAGSVDVIEGNTAVGNDANGGMVMRRGRGLDRARFARIPGSVPVVEVEIVKPWIPLLFHWYLNERKPGLEPPTMIGGVPIPPAPWPKSFWAMVESAEMFRAAKPDSSAEAAALRAKIAAAKAALG